MAGCPKHLLSKLPKVQNHTARLTFRTTRFAHVTPTLHSLHWLPIEQRIEYKLSLLCFNIISHQASVFLSDLGGSLKTKTKQTKNKQTKTGRLGTTQCELVPTCLVKCIPYCVQRAKYANVCTSNFLVVCLLTTSKHSVQNTR